MKTSKINPNQIREGVANFSIEYRSKKIQAVDGGPNCQRFIRLTEIPMFQADHIKPERTVWHELYSEDLVDTKHFKKFLNKIGKQFQWKGNFRDLFKLTDLMFAI